jgi:hypothetical protein
MLFLKNLTYRNFEEFTPIFWEKMKCKNRCQQKTLPKCVSVPCMVIFFLLQGQSHEKVGEIRARDVNLGPSYILSRLMPHTHNWPTFSKEMITNSIFIISANSIHYTKFYYSKFNFDATPTLTNDTLIGSKSPATFRRKKY